MKTKALKILGLMSGSSLDGLDLALCRFDHTGNNYSFSVIRSETIIYPAFIKDRLKSSMLLGTEDLISFDHEYGRFIGKTCLDFLVRNSLEADYIASHGHTVFHDPSKGYTLQAGNGHDIAVACGIPVIWDFRSMDVALGGQGAPLVPVGDDLLFSQYDACLNLGGIANISYRKAGSRIAFDICPVNMALNELAERAGLEFDEDGMLGRQGKIREGILNSLE